MKATLNSYQKNEMRRQFLTGNFSVESERSKLVNEGFDEKTAGDAIAQVLKEYKYEVFQNKLNHQRNEEKKKLTYMVSLMAGIAGPVFSISNIVWYILACAVAGAAGYYGHPDKPLAGITGSITLVVLFPVTYIFFMGGRSSYVTIELLLPLLLAIIPAYGLQWLVAKMFYRQNEC